ncbi:uncharacterized protein MONOS_9248 [Monocercomonoides exilis]|uniref:uncharacterized protein n=1 Tax=Monocercomonoides exilis TaxID=2049356 RepID=UPI003559DCBE|nr:hypothetical protein MONOS_9248 [Monocercomonoides exilis]|eukprot:MONOS_9248.1-p1 / transcript=MONOS_9248.1 / gene=MONOS_9248 / organism=Monocercomonoides_exilis_PA203 / gene_product=unspecified product / transcript_product=unspecified product / location=Mono_scaffold00374:42564-43043(+) / protein_length=160 / sequence_SO=supercontig / SO=protein_coding / is_pseudo=false
MPSSIPHPPSINLLVPVFNISSMHPFSDPYPGRHYLEMHVGICPLLKRYLLSYLSAPLLRASQAKQEILKIFALYCAMKQELLSEEAISVAADVAQFLMMCTHPIEKELIVPQMKKLKRLLDERKMNKTNENEKTIEDEDKTKSTSKKKAKKNKKIKDE